ncbi:hypothetical protein CYMTET_26904 [Cymbomonas tetramitiformis]|uniref:Uncharacterized protein n=1 Tax=Cymbomonas tetramitiformis TaxID=36881 RepID=A0AAE0KXE9_9CHLO|nr:hypothetical protein CYMTET_26904 [Cymbomonas tetramitiformis]
MELASIAVQTGDHAADVPKRAKLLEVERKAKYGPLSTVLVGVCCEHKGDNTGRQGLTAGFKLSWSLRTKVEQGLGEGYALTTGEAMALGNKFKAQCLCEQDLHDLWTARGYANDALLGELTSLEDQGLPKHTAIFSMSSVSSPIALPNKWQTNKDTEQKAAHETEGNLDKNIYEGLGDTATIIEMGVAYLWYYECGFGFSSVKEVVDDVWDMPPRYDHIEQELLQLIQDPRPLLDGKEATWRSPTRTGLYHHMFGADVKRPKPVIANGIREYLASEPNEVFLLAAGLMTVCIRECLRVFRNFSKTQLASQGGAALRKEVVPVEVREALPKIPPSNSEIESLLGRYKQEKRKKYNQKPRTAEVQVQSRSLGFYHETGSMETLTPTVLRYAMQETKRREPEERLKKQLGRLELEQLELEQLELEQLEQLELEQLELELLEQLELGQLELEQLEQLGQLQLEQLQQLELLELLSSWSWSSWSWSCWST